LKAKRVEVDPMDAEILSVVLAIKILNIKTLI
jgi:hypothetical protein